MKLRYFIAVSVVFLIAFGIVLIGYVSNTVAMSTYSVQLENAYQSSLHDLLTSINDIEVTISKSLVSESKIAKEKAYYELWQQTIVAQSALSKLPISHQSVNETTSFINQLGGFSYYLFDKVNSGQDISTDDYKSLESLYDWVKYVQKELQKFYNSTNYDYSILNDVDLNSQNSQSIQSSFTSMQSEPTIEYPTLIYDGPFSDSVLNKEAKGINGEEITIEKGKEIIQDKLNFYGIETIEYQSETKGKFITFDYLVKTLKGSNIYVQITKKGGFILTITSYEKINSTKFSLVDCEKIAENFAKIIGINDMKVVWSTSSSRIAYINICTIKNSTIIYPEMIKVKISQDTGNIVGWEAMAYAYNKDNRTITSADITENEARSKVSSRLTIDSYKMCIIPLEYNKESFCYEYKCNFNDYVYYVYIDASTGEQVNILRVITTTNGNLLM